MNPLDMTHLAHGGAGTGRQSVYNRLVASQIAQAIPQQTHRLLRKASILTNASSRRQEEYSHPSRSDSGDQNTPGPSYLGPDGPPSPILRRVSYVQGGKSHSPARPQAGVGPILETVTNAAKDPNNPSLPLPSNLTTDDFTRAVAVTVSALRHREGHGGEHDPHAGGGHGGHEAPSWSRLTSATVLLGCTALYAAIAGEWE